MVNVELIERLRVEHGYSKKKVAEFMGYESHTAYQRKVIGVREFTIADVIKICKLYQLELNDVIMM